MYATSEQLVSPLTSDDLAQLQAIGKQEDAAVRELRLAARGSRHVRLLRPCNVWDGVLRHSPVDKDRYALLFQNKAREREVTVFISASGSASRMFDSYHSLPKVLIPFHCYPNGHRTPLDEHLVEAALYACGSGGTIRIHLTVSPAFREVVHDHLSGARRRYSTPTVCFETSLSVQNPETDVLVLDEDNRPLRCPDGTLLLKPAGHGALLDNLNALRGDIVFIRTVDNVLPDRHKRDVVFHKTVLGGYLFALEQRTHRYLDMLACGNCPPVAIRRIRKFARGTFSHTLPPRLEDLSESEWHERLYGLLNRPIRICGVVPSDGKPGGAPFWVAASNGAGALRIVDGPEVDSHDEGQVRIWRSSTYFNPVDIVCSVRDYEGHPFNLTAFADLEAGMVVSRCHQGRPIRIPERPGLWNGSMAYWNTVFVEVPSHTAAPVKSFSDLSSPLHQV